MNFDADRIELLIKGREYDEAIRRCSLQLKDTPLSKEFLHLKGMAEYMSGRLTQSIQSFKAVLEIDPKYIDSAILLSVIYNDTGRYDEAKRVFDLANQSVSQKKFGTDESTDRRFALKHLELGDLYFKFNRFDEALDEYQKSIKLDPSFADCRIKIAKVYAKKGFVSRAIQELANLVSSQPEHIQANLQLGLLYFSQGNVIDAVQNWEKVLQVNPHHSEAKEYLKLASCASETTN